MTEKLSIHVSNFNEKVRIMNQSQRKELVLSAQDARNLHADIFALLAQIAELSQQPQQTAPSITSISMDGGHF